MILDNVFFLSGFPFFLSDPLLYNCNFLSKNYTPKIGHYMLSELSGRVSFNCVLSASVKGEG